MPPSLPYPDSLTPPNGVSGVETAIEKVVAANPGSRVSSFFNTGDDLYVSNDRTITFANV